MNHFSVVCKSGVSEVDVEYDSDCLSVSTPDTTPGNFLLEVEIMGSPTSVLIDTGAAVSLLPQTLAEALKLGKPQPTAQRLISYGGVQIPTIGRLKNIKVKVGKLSTRLNFIVVVRGQPILGRDSIAKLNLITLNVNAIEAQAPETIVVSADAQPRFCKPRKLPFALEEPVKQELLRLEGEGIITPVDNSDWATPIVVVHKSNGKVRVCGDYQATVNPFIPKSVTAGLDIDDTLARLADCDKFSKIDLKDAYLHVPLDDPSQKYTVISTPFGLYKYRFLPLGIKSAPHIFQSKMEKLLMGLKGVFIHLDDVLLATSSDKEHETTLAEILRRLKTANLPVNETKSVYNRTSVYHLGYLIEKNTIKPDPEKIEVLLNVKEPKDCKEIQRFLGAVGFYSKFIPQFADLAQPLREVMLSDEFTWGAEQRASFEGLKTTLGDGVLRAFNPADDIELESDASPFAVGAVLSQRGRPVLYISKTLSAAERNYSQLDREALGIVYAVKRLHKYLYGRHFTIVTDHKPLEYIFKPAGVKSAHANGRVIRWAVFLSGYEFTIVGKRTHEIPVADWLSRLDVQKDATTFDVGSVDIFHEADATLRETIVRITKNNKHFQSLKHYVQFGWPKTLKHLSASLRPYSRVQQELSFHGELLYRGGRIVIPKPLRSNILAGLHSSHLGIVKMKSLVRGRYWWPGVDAEVEDLCKTCGPCLRVKQSTTVAETSWPATDQPFNRLHIDYAGPVEGYYFLVIVDAATNYPFVFKTTSQDVQVTLSKLREVFGLFGLPKCIVADNGPSFRAEAFNQYFSRRGVQVWHTPVKHPKSNGLVERFVGNLKLHLKITQGKGDLDSRLHSFLLQYRCAGIHSGKPPAERLLSFTPNLPSIVANPGEPILYQRFEANNTSTFEPAIVVSNTGRTCVNVYDQFRDTVHTRHQEQVKQTAIRTETPEDLTQIVPDQPIIGESPLVTNDEVSHECAAAPEILPLSSAAPVLTPEVSHSVTSERPRRTRRPPAWHRNYQATEEDAVLG